MSHTPLLAPAGPPGPRVGHTLWEVLLVLATIGVIGALVAPALAVRAARQNDAAATADRIMAITQRARLHALGHGVTVEVIIDPATARYWSYERAGDDLRLTESGAVERAVTVTLQSGTARPRLTFRPTGSARGDELVVRGDAGIRRITVDPWVGSAHVTAQ